MITDLERALSNGVAPWSDLVYRTTTYWVFKDGYPVTEGHLLFVPAYETPECVLGCFEAANIEGYKGCFEGKWDAFNIGQNVGEAAGQTVMYPHIHMIPRRVGDMEDPRGGVRHVIPNKGNYKNGCKK